MIKRRKFLTTASAGAVAAIASATLPEYGLTYNTSKELALLGGKSVRTKAWPKWPQWDRDAEDEIISVLRSGNWFRGRGTKVSEFEEKYAEMMGAKRCLATSSGTTALLSRFMFWALKLAMRC